jgi:teichuronic acid exporter
MLKRRAFIAILWSGGDIALRQGMQFFATMILARLLLPADFGVMAMLSVFVGVAYVLMDGGFSVALIQRRDIDHVDESTVFWCNLGIGVLLTLLLFAAAPLIADFYGTPVLAPLMRVMSLSCLLASLGSIHGTLLTRQLDFRTQAKAGGIAALLSGIVAIILAIRGYGVWALAAQALVMAASLSALLWILHPWRPAWTFSRGSLRKLFGFGGFHLASSLLEMGYSRLYTLVVGRMFGARDLGFYANADNSRQIPGNVLGSLVARVALPMFSAAAHDRVLLRRGIQLSIRGMMLINAPVMLGMAALAEPIVSVLFGQQWLPAAPILQVLCISGLLYPIHAINLHALMALIKKVIGVGLLVFGALYGVIGVAWSQVVFSLVVLVFNTYYTKRWLGYGAWAQLREIGPSSLAAALVAGAAHFASRAWHAPALVQLAMLGAAGAIAYLSILAGARVHAMQDVMALLPRSRNGRAS